MQELLASVIEIGAQVLQQQKSPAEEQTICMALLPPLLGAAFFGIRALSLRLKAK
jgi:hypothetical protein